MKINLPVTAVERHLPAGRCLVSKTDLKGIITYANEAFVEQSGYTRDELIGGNHNIVRHPDMPAEAFADLWETLKEGLPWRGIVKNRCKNGDYYWVDAFVAPVLKGMQVVGYISVRSRPSVEAIRVAESIYAGARMGNAKSAKGSRWRQLSIKNRLMALTGCLALIVAAVASLMPGRHQGIERRPRKHLPKGPGTGRNDRTGNQADERQPGAGHAGVTASPRRLLCIDARPWRDDAYGYDRPKP